jgi:hypothetical protein
MNRYLIPCHRDLRKSLDSMAAETDSQAKFHLILSQQFRSELEIPTTAFHARLLHHKTMHQAAIEKLFDIKQTWEQRVNQVRENYKRIKSFKDVLGIEQFHSIQTYGREWSNSRIALQETVIKWEQSCKSFCASFQDMEENRMDFVKGNLLNYANAVSKTYVADAAVRFLSPCTRQYSQYLRNSVL